MTTNGYFHYIQLAVPALALGLILALQWASKKSVIATVTASALVMLPVLGIYGLRASHYAERAGESRYYQQSQEILNSLSVSERDEVYAWNVEPKFFIINDLLPLQRFYFFQDFWGSIDPKIYNEVADFVRSDHPQWIVTSAAGIGNTEVAEVVAIKYELVTKNEDFVLYKFTP